MTDPISDMLIRIKNAQMARLGAASFGYSKIKMEIAKILEREGYLKEVARKGKKNRKLIEAELIYLDGMPKISGIKRISKPSRRTYKGFREIFHVKNGLGLAVYSTPKGLLTDREAKKQKIGGELLLEIW